MSLTVTRKGEGPALIRTRAPRTTASKGRLVLAVLAILLALILAFPALAQVAPAAPVPGVGDAV
ncbi:MAG TPA: flagellar biosynthetic protein FliP, partial [Sphingomonas sp.]|nr:flagellar biosynthetic protein FliP [Sphingomonas sp.]